MILKSILTLRMIICLLTGIFASKNAYYLVLLYVCASFSYFMVMTKYFIIIRIFIVVVDYIMDILLRLVA